MSSPASRAMASAMATSWARLAAAWGEMEPVSIR